MPKISTSHNKDTVCLQTSVHLIHVASESIFKLFISYLSINLWLSEASGTELLFNS